MKGPTTSALCLLLLACVVAAKSLEPKLIVEAHAYFANDTAFAKENTYLRVYDDGRVEYTDKKDGEKNYVRHESKLTAEQLKSLTDFLAQQDVVSLSGMYAPYPPSINFATEIDVFISRGDKTQIVATHNWKPPIGRRDGSTSPPALVSLICRLESLRETAAFRVTAEGYCSK